MAAAALPHVRSGAFGRGAADAVPFSDWQFEASSRYSLPKLCTLCGAASTGRRGRRRGAGWAGRGCLITAGTTNSPTITRGRVIGGLSQPRLAFGLSAH